MKMPMAVCAVAAMLFPALVARAAERDTTFYHDVDLVLEGGLTTGTSQKDLLLHLGTLDGKWDKYATGWAGPYWRASGSLSPKARWFNAMDHEGVVESVKQDGDKVTVTLKMNIHADPWVIGGGANYTLDLTRKGHVFSGTFTGTFKDQPVQGAVAGKMREKPWPSPAPNVEPFKPGEHPRVIFRKSDVPALRARMNTPEGKWIIARLKEQLGGGEAMPTDFQTATKAYGGGKKVGPGGYTLSHGMGFGLLYQLTGEQKYADLARQCVDKAVVEKVRDADQRYSFDRPGGKLRAGSSYAAIAMAYDLCYDAWPPEYREQLAKAIQYKIIRKEKPGSVEMEEAGGEDPDEKAMAEPVNGDLVFNTLGGQHSPFSNHYGAWIGGGGHALLAIMNDPGTDDELTALGHRIFQRRAKRALEVGYGTAGFFFEGHYCGRLSTNTGLSTYLQALRVAEGKDFITNSPEASHLLTKWIYETVRHNGKLHTLQRGMYSADHLTRVGHSGGGEFSQGFGILPPAHTPAVLWFFNNVINPVPQKDFDCVTYPQRTVYSYVNWPFDVKEQNPLETMPKYLRDTKAGYYVFRAGWSGTDDDIVATLYVSEMQNHTPALGIKSPGAIFGMGVRADFMGLAKREEKFEDVDKGQACLIHSGTQAFFADMTGKSGAPLMLVEVGNLGGVGGRPGLPRPANRGDDDNAPRLVRQYLRVGPSEVTVTTVGRGKAPLAEVKETKDFFAVHIGKRVLSFTRTSVTAETAP